MHKLTSGHQLDSDEQSPNTSPKEHTIKNQANKAKQSRTTNNQSNQNTMSRNLFTLGFQGLEAVIVMLAAGSPSVTVYNSCLTGTSLPDMSVYL